MNPSRDFWLAFQLFPGRFIDRLLRLGSATSQSSECGSSAATDYGRDALSEEWRPVSFRSGEKLSTVAHPPFPVYYSHDLPLVEPSVLARQREGVAADERAKKMRDRLIASCGGVELQPEGRPAPGQVLFRVNPWIVPDEVILR